MAVSLGIEALSVLKSLHNYIIIKLEWVKCCSDIMIIKEKQESLKLPLILGNILFNFLKYWNYFILKGNQGKRQKNI